MKNKRPTDGFIIYKEIFRNGPGYRFTIDEMTERINSKHPDIPRNKIKRKINNFTRDGLLRQHEGGLSVK